MISGGLIEGSIIHNLEMRIFGINEAESIFDDVLVFIFILLGQMTHKRLYFIHPTILIFSIRPTYMDI